MSTYICMSSINISITEEVYNRLKSLKKEGESFSDVIRNMVKEKDISRCYGLFKGDDESVDIIRKEAKKARKQRWKEVKL
jgi:predicted CopG family antitoxin